MRGANTPGQAIAQLGQPLRRGARAGWLFHDDTGRAVGVLPPPPAQALASGSQTVPRRYRRPARHRSAPGCANRRRSTRRALRSRRCPRQWVRQYHPSSRRGSRCRTDLLSPRRCYPVEAGMGALATVFLAQAAFVSCILRRRRSKLLAKTRFMTASFALCQR